MQNTKVWLVTGASKGLGLSLVLKLLEKGYHVIATSRNVDKIEYLKNDKNNFLPVAMEVTSPESIEKAIKTGLDFFGQIDVIVNNAGFGLLGTLEEFSIDEIKNCFEVNVFGVINVCKTILPHFRKQNSGVILNIASVSGSVCSPTTGIYSASKASVIQISESLAKEVEEFNIHVSAICPGGFSTDFLDKSSLLTAKNPIQEYTLVRSVVNRYHELNKQQGGDPEKGAEAFIKIAEMPNPPSRIYIGSDALRMVDNKINQIKESIIENKALSTSTDKN